MPDAARIDEMKTRITDLHAQGEAVLFVTPAEFEQLRTLEDERPPEGHGFFMRDALGALGTPVVVDSVKATEQRQRVRNRRSSFPPAT